MYDKVTVWYKFCIHLYEVYACHSLVSARSVLWAAVQFYTHTVPQYHVHCPSAERSTV